MHVVKGDLFSQVCDAIVIPTNGFVKHNGENVMGAGVAKITKTKYPIAPLQLGRKIKQNGNIVQVIVQCKPNLRGISEYDLVAFPVKPVWGTVEEATDRHKKDFSGGPIPGWGCKANLELIEQSCKQLVALTNERGYSRVCLPKVGCGNGELKWETVEPILEKYLDHRFTIVFYRCEDL